MNLILSIHPKYVDKILAGEKKWEYRKSIFRKPKDEIDRAYIYTTSPVKRITASFEIGRILHDEPEELWKKTGRNSGVSKNDLMQYFKGRDRGYALEITHLREEDIDPYEEFEDFHPPQSFMYAGEF